VTAPPTLPTVAGRPRRPLPHRNAGHATDLDGFIARSQPTWDRLDDLTRRAGREPGRLGSDELDELVRLHLRVSSQLSYARTHLADPETSAYLSALVGRSNAVVHGTKPRTWAAVVEGITRTFPAAVWHARLPILVSTLVFMVSAGLMGAWLATTPAALEVAMPAEAREAYLDREFEAYYSSEPGTTFAARVFTNNAAVGALAFGIGILWAVPTLAVLVLNGVNVGVAAGLFHAAGDAGRFYGLILPHGLLELTAIFIAGGAGLRLGWAAIAPGDRTRPDALLDEGRRAVVIVMGLVLVFLVAGLLEGYVTGQPWPTWVRVGIGGVVWAAFCSWIVVAGRAAAAVGLTGALGERAIDAPGSLDVTAVRAP
jgi:uncharacterized membrane protein SpoIIM required for sporulation